VSTGVFGSDGSNLKDPEKSFAIIFRRAYLFKIGIDVGGTKIEGVVLDATNVEQRRMRITTDQHSGYNTIVKRVVSIVEALEGQIGHQRASIGVGSPGAADQETGELRYCNIHCMNGKNFAADLSEAFEKPVRVTNDANCFALAEATLGAAKGCRMVFGMVLGTGCGGGLVFNRQIWNGASGIAGEWGHSSLIFDGPDCYCGRRGCVERYLSGNALEVHYETLSGVSENVQTISDRSIDGDPLPIRVINHFVESFSQATANLITVLDPHVIVIGGGLSGLPQIYTEGLCHLRQNIMGKPLNTLIVKNRLGASSGVIGAALEGQEIV